MLELELEVLKRITPTEQETSEVAHVCEELLKKAADIIKNLDTEALPLVVGSVAKGTWLKNPDIDIFILFQKHLERKKLEGYGIEIGRKILHGGELRYAEHPYTSGVYRGYEIDIVPCYKIERASERMTAVDRTPLHTKYILENLPEEQKKDVRLLKQFLKGINCYGAEAQIQGFSGYLCELLILYYKNFKNLLHAVGNWKLPKRIELVKSSAAFDNSLVVIDPVDPSRNVASALSIQNLSVFIHACKEYLKNPGLEFFFPNEPKPLSKSELIKKLKLLGTTIIAVEFENPYIIHDNLYPQLRKCVQAILQLCKEHEFKIINSNFYVDTKNVLITLEFEIFKLPNMKKHLGPIVWSKNSTKFLTKWLASEKALSKPYIENDRWVVNVKRDYLTAEELIRSKLKSLSLGKDIDANIKKGFKIIGIEQLASTKYRNYISAFLDKRFRWKY